MEHKHNAGKDLNISIIITLVVLAVEIVGGILSNSLALLSDAAHVFTHITALGLALVAVKLCSAIPTERKTFGYHRTEIIVALVNGLTLIVVAFFIVREAYQRYLFPEEIKGIQMLVIAVIGLIGNLIVLFKLKEHHSLSIRGAFLHVLGDTLSSVIVIFGAIWIYFTDNFIIDPVLSIIIAVIVAFSALSLIRDSLNVLLEGVPKGIKIDEVVKEMKKAKGVKGVHSINVWTLCSDVNALNAHVYVNETYIKNTEKIIKSINKRLDEKFNIRHTTLQFECKECKIPKKIGRIKH